MSMWLCRAGSSGEFENKFLEENRIYCTWDNLSDVPFATSGGSGMGKTAQILSKICPDATEAIVRHVLSLGINFFDTANGYSADTLRSKTDRIEMRDMEIVRRIQELAEGHGGKMQQIALAWHWAKGVASPIVGGTKMSHYDDAADALDVTLTPEEVVYCPTGW